MSKVSLINGTDTCVICGRDIPEGSQVCVICGKETESGENKVYDAIVDYISKHQYPPTVRDLCQLTGYKSTSTIFAKLKALEEKGYIKLDVKVSRGIKVEARNLVDFFRYGEMHCQNHSNMKNTIEYIHQISIKRQKEIDSAVLMEIKDIAIENGIKIEYLLNEKAIINAFEKQISKKPNIHGFRDGREINTISFTCPICNKHIGRENFCKHCGQALDWSDTE